MNTVLKAASSRLQQEQLLESQESIPKKDALLFLDNDTFYRASLA